VGDRNTQLSRLFVSARTYLVAFGDKKGLSGLHRGPFPARSSGVYSAIVNFQKLLLISPVIVMLTGVSAFTQCPPISVVGPAGVTNPGDEMIFRVEDGIADWKYAWSLDQGVIMAGQGTTAIRVATNSIIAGSNVTATVVVEGLDPRCPKTAYGIAPVASLPIGEPIDDWPDSLPSNDKRGRLDAFFAELANNPDHVGIMVVKVTGKERQDGRNPRVQFVLRHVRFRQFDKRRIWFAFERGPEKRAVFWRMLPTLKVPCDKCLIIKGSDL